MTGSEAQEDASTSQAGLVDCEVTVAEEGQLVMKISATDLAGDSEGAALEEATKSGINADAGNPEVSAAADDIAKEEQKTSQEVIARNENEEDAAAQSPKEATAAEEDGDEQEGQSSTEATATEAEERSGSGVGKQTQNVELVMDAAKLLEKLNIAENSDGESSGGGGDDDLSSSMDSTANSGLPQMEGNDEKAASSEDCSEGGPVRPKKRIDLQHQFVRGIVKIQYDRDHYEKQCQTKKQEEVKVVRVTPDKAKAKADNSGKKPSSSRASSRSAVTNQKKREVSKGQFSFMDTSSVADVQPKASQVRPYTSPAASEDGQQQPPGDKIKQERSASIYRPPNLRNAEAEALRPSTRSSFTKDGTSPSPAFGKTSRELAENIRITFDTERQKRSIQLSKPPTAVSGKGDFDAARKERLDSWNNQAGESPGGDAFKYKDLPSSFEFKATAFGKNPNEESPSPAPAETERRIVRGSGRFRGPRTSRNFPMFEVGATPRCDDYYKNGFDLEVNSKRSGYIVIPELPPKDKPFAAEMKWGDMVESESEASPISNAENASTSSTPDVFEWNNNASTAKRKTGSKKPKQKKKEWRNSPPPRPQQQQQQQQLEIAKSQASESQNTNSTRPSVWERLGPRPSLGGTSRLRTVYYEPNSMDNFREMAEREYFCKGEVNETDPAELAVGAAYKGTKQKRTRMELYVPRRGGSQA